MTISATVGTSVLALSGTVPTGSFLPTWTVWWTGDAMGVLLVAPLLLSLRAGPPPPPPPRGGGGGGAHGGGGELGIFFRGGVGGGGALAGAGPGVLIPLLHHLGGAVVEL